MKKILEVSDLTVSFSTRDGDVRAVNGISFDIHAGEAIGIVGESGSGKSQTFLGLMGLLAKNGRVSGEAKLDGQPLIGLDDEALANIRGVDMSMIFQDPMTSLNPYLKVSTQMTEVLIEHRGMSTSDAKKRAIDMLDLVRMPEAKKRLDMYPHEFSGGMRQRVMIAMALLCEPKLLIADEPTTALDVTVQAQILKLLRELKRDINTAIALVTHDLGVVASVCERVLVMYGGRLQESAPANSLFAAPRHPYTRGLLASTPRLDQAQGEALATIAGYPPNLQNLPTGCAFHPRCQQATARCQTDIPKLDLLAEQHWAACHQLEHTHE